MYRPDFMQRAIALSRQALDTAGTEPFGVVVVKDGRIVGEGLNHSRARHDPTSHGEVEAIRDACRQLETVDLRGCEMYTSCEPCAMCVAAMELSGISRLYYAASLAQSERALGGLSLDRRFTVDIGRLRRQAGLPVEARAMPAEQQMDREAVEVLDAWAAGQAGAD